MKLYISPRYAGPDKGDGGIRRVIEAQERWLPKMGFELVNNINDTDIAAFHAGMWEDPNPNISVVAHTHGLYWDEYNWPGNWYERINKEVIRTLKQADAVSAPSMWVADALRRGMWLDPWVLYHGIEPTDWPERTSPEDGYILWNKTRVDPICDPEPLNRLAVMAQGEHFVSTFGDRRPNIEVTGNMPYEQGREYTRNAGIYLATSRETFGIATLEAMAAGVPVLGFAFGGQPEVVVHKQHGYLAKPGDYDDLLKGLEYIRAHHKYLSFSARQHVLEEFTWELMMQQYVRLYETVHQEKRGGVKVSFVITNYNLGRYLPQAVASAKAALSKLTQSGEVIVVDDASTEPLPSVVEDDKEIFVVKNPVNVYLAEALNIGIAHASGEYIYPLDADNYVDPVGFTDLVNALDKDRALDIAYGKMRVFGDADETSPGFVSGWPPAYADLDEQLRHHNQITSSSLYRKKVWRNIGGYRRRCPTAEDADFWTRALALGYTGRQVTEAPVLNYRDRSDSMSRVQKDWPWHEWYGWANSADRSWVRGGAVHIHDVPLVSVVIPVGRGHERYVLDALDSLVAQNKTFWNWEAIVVNDTGKRIPWLHPWARVVNGQGKGVSHARNIGTHFARADYILYLDADDFLHPDALYHMYNVALSSTCPRVFVYTDWFSAEDGARHNVEEFNPSDLLTKLPYPVSCLYKKNDLIDAGIRWDESFKDGWEDWDYALQVVSKGICGIRLAAPFLHYRLGTGSLRNRARSKLEEIKAKINDKWINFKGNDMPASCGGCGGGRYPSLMAAVVDTGVFEGVNLDTETSLIQYNAPEDWTGTRSFLGRVTGNRYRFSPQDRVKRVYNADVQGLLDLGFFSPLVNAIGEVTALQADGPPNAA